MHNKKLLLTSVLAFISISAIFSLSGAQLGEYAGHVRFNVSIGSSETLQMTIFNSGNQSINFQVQDATLMVVPNETLHTANATTPTVTVSPMNGTLAPNQNRALNITVFVPIKNNQPGMSWHGIVSAYEVSSAQSSGASVQTGVGKIITVVAIAPVGPNYGMILEIVVIVVVVAGAVGGAFFAIKRRKGAKRAASTRASQAKTAPSRHRARKTTAKKGAARKKRPSATRRRSTSRRTATRRRQRR